MLIHITPPIHSTNPLTVSGQRVMNMAELNIANPAVSIKEGTTYLDWFEHTVKQRGKANVKMVVRDVRKHKPGTMVQWGEREIKRMFSPDRVQEPLLVFTNQSMWGTLEWKGQVAGWNDRKQVQIHSMYPDHTKKLARRIAEAIGKHSQGQYYALHIRRGDKVKESNFGKVSHSVDWYISRLDKLEGDSDSLVDSTAESPNKKDIPIYIMTDEKDRAFFSGFAQAGYHNVLFHEDLPLGDELEAYLSKFPSRMRMDVLGMVEQLIGAYSLKFLGSGYSTFTTYILRLRKYQKFIGRDTSITDSEDMGLPLVARTHKSTCNPLHALTHATPC